MPSELYNPADSKEVKAFNSSVTFCDSAHEVTREEREIAENNVTRLIEETKRLIK